MDKNMKLVDQAIDEVSRDILVCQMLKQENSRAHHSLLDDLLQLSKIKEDLNEKRYKQKTSYRRGR